MHRSLHAERQKTRRTANACVACRQSKIKCTGESPCSNCHRRSVKCVFAEAANKILVSERYLQELRDEARHHRGWSTQSSLGVEPQTPTQAGSQHTPAASSPLESRGGAEQDFLSPGALSSPVGRDAATDGYASGAAPGMSPSVVRDHPDPAIVSPPLTTEFSQPGRLELGSRSGPGPSGDPALGPLYPDEHASSPLGVWSIPFTIPAKTMRNTRKNKRVWVWLATWSTWSFAKRLMLMLSEHLFPEDPSLPDSVTDPDIYNLPLDSATPSPDGPDLTGLPSESHALYLLSTVKFHFGHAFRLLDEARFERELRAFYAGAPQAAPGRHVWLSKLLMVLAFGTAFHGSVGRGREPPGARFFARAVALIPHSASLWKDSLLGIEVLALAALYTFSLDERETAYIFLGQALRIAQLEGLHTQLPEDELGEGTVGYCRDLWWTLYILDRHISCSVGLPMSIQQSDITMPVNPSYPLSPEDSARSLQVNLSHLLSVILTTVYKPEKVSLGAFLEQTRSILRTLAQHAQDIEGIVSQKLINVVGTMSQDTRYIMLLYHQCVILATRPLLLSVLKERLDMLRCPGYESWEDFLAQAGVVISAGISSAVKTLSILTSEYSLTNVFLPYDIEFTFGAAIHLTMAATLFPDVANYDDCRQSAHGILADLTSRGNRVALARREELSHLEGLFQTLVARVRRQGHQALDLSCFNMVGMAADVIRRGSEQERMAGVDLDPQTMGEVPNPEGLATMHPPMTSEVDFLDDLGISSEAFLSIVQQIGDPETLPDDMLTLD